MAVTPPAVGTVRAQAPAENAASTDGATLTLRMTPPDGTGATRAALEIALDEGWKTYWTAPGPVGLAPRMETSRSADLADIAFLAPAPEWFEEAGERSAGYTRPLAFAIEARASGSAPRIELDVVIGLCREICVPFSARLAADPSPGLSARAAVEAAFSALPEAEATPEAWRAALSQDAADLDVIGPALAPGAELFVDGPEGWEFDRPVRLGDAEGPARFRATVLRRPAQPAPFSVAIVATAGESARSLAALPVSLP